MQTEFFQNGMTFEPLETQFALGTDAMLLADFAADSRGAVCDLCAGCGQVGLLMAAQGHENITCVELQQDACKQAQRNIDENGLAGKMQVVCADVREIRTLLPHGSFNTVVCNPPYYPAGSGFAAKDERIAISRTELLCTLEDVCAAAAWLLQTGGSLFLVHKPERLTDVLLALRTHKLEPKLLRYVRHRADAPYTLILLKAVAGGKPGLTYAPTLTLFEAGGTPTDEYRRIYHLE